MASSCGALPRQELVEDLVDAVAQVLGVERRERRVGGTAIAPSGPASGARRRLPERSEP